MGRATAIFDTQAQAEQAVSELRKMGVTETQLSFVSRHAEAEVVASGVGKGALAGAGVGAAFGLAAALIPGIGPFIAAGSLVPLLGATVGGIATGAIVGGTAGAVASALTKAGYTADEAKYYGTAVERGNVLVAVETDTGVSDVIVRSVLTQHGGHAYNP